jgi:transposase
VTDRDAGQLRPAFFSAGGDLLLQADLGGGGNGGHEVHDGCRGRGVAAPPRGPAAGQKRGMRITSPFAVALTESETKTLTATVRRSTAAVRDVLRARIVLLAAAGQSNAEIAWQLGVCLDTVRKWRRRFTQGRLAGLGDKERSGRPPSFTAVQVAAVKALACEPPERRGLTLCRWSSAELARTVVAQHLLAGVSASTVRRWLAKDALQPWRQRCWIFPRDPDFVVKAERVLDLYDRRWKGRRLRPDEYVISADEKPGVQALRRAHPSLTAGPGRPPRVEFEYRRGGTLAYLAAYDVHQATVFGRCEPTTGIVPFTALVDQVMSAEPYRTAKRVFWVIDNGSSHSGVASVARMNGRWPNAVLVHLPVHASWLNQVEVFFSILQRKAITGGDFTDLGDLADKILGFQQHYNTAASPFDWKFTKTKLRQLMERLAAHSNPDQLAA